MAQERIRRVIRFVDLERQYASIGGQIDAAIAEVVRSNQYILGPAVKRFESEFARYCRVEHCIGVGSGTSALRLALEAVGVGEGDEVVLPATTFIATAFAVSQLGAKPVLVDVDPASMVVSAQLVESALTSKTKALIPVHLYGAPVDMAPLLKLARARRIAVIEDACQAHGARIDGKRVGTLGQASVFSFYPAKNLGAYGDAGAVTTNDPEIAAKVRLLHDQGQRRKYDHVVRGDNSRLDSIQAAILSVKLRYLDAWNAARRERANWYDELLASSGMAIAPRSRGESVYHIYAAAQRERPQAIEALTREGIGFGIHYPLPIHLQPAYADLGYRRGDFPVSEAWSEQTLSLPMFAELSRPEIERVVSVLANASRSRGRLKLFSEHRPVPQRSTETRRKRRSFSGRTGT